MKILALDSSGLTASVAILEEEKLTAEYTINYKKTHSQTLVPMLEAVKNMTELDLSTIDAIAVAAGPGSFTGLRIGSATAKGLGLALDKPIIPVPTVDGLAYVMYGTDKVICPLMDARRGQVYTGLYCFVRETEEKESTYVLQTLQEQCAVSIEWIIDKCNALGREVIFLGDGVPVFKNVIQEKLQTTCSFAPAYRQMQSAAAVGTYAFSLYKKGKYETAAGHQPDYLRLSQAERERLEKEGRNPALVIRKMEEKDLEEVSAIENQSFSTPWSLRAYKDVLKDKCAHYLVAEENGEIIGMCGLHNIAGEGDITNVAVKPSCRGKKTGWELMNALLLAGAGEGISEFTLEVRAGNTAAVHLYRKLGFKEEGRRKNFYENPREDALIMWKR